MEKRGEMKRVVQFLSALAALALLTALFSGSSLHEPITGQLHALGQMRAGQLENLIEGTTGVPSAHTARQALQQAVQADLSGGFYEAPVKVKLTASPPGPVFYTLDGSVPSEKSSRYDGPIPIQRTAVLSFAGMSSELVARPVEVRTFLIGEPEDMPVLSLAVNPAFLWNRHAGLYLNPFKRGSGWRRPAQAEYFEERHSPPLRFPVQMEVHGNWSRGAAKKSFELTYVPAAMPPDRNNILASPGDKDASRAVVVRAAAMDVSYRLGEELFRDVYADSGGSTTRAVLVRLLLNGTPWGLYNLHEKIDKTFLKRRYGAGDYDLVDGAGYRRSRDGVAWNRMLDFFMTYDLGEENNFEKALRLIDVENFTDYWLFNIYSGNVDWPQSNYYAYRNRAPGKRWRWLSWDADAAFDIDRGLHHDTLAWATRDELRHDLSYNGDDIDFKHWLVSTAIVRNLLKHRGYRDQFVRRFCTLHSTYFQPDRLQARFQAILDRMTLHLDADWQRWPGSKRAYLKGVQDVRRFIRERPAIVLEHFQTRFGFTACPAL
jgi:hypothetical protein